MTLTNSLSVNLSFSIRSKCTSDHNVFLLTISYHVHFHHTRLPSHCLCSIWPSWCTLQTLHTFGIILFLEQYPSCIEVGNNTLYSKFLYTSTHTFLIHTTLFNACFPPCFPPPQPSHFPNNHPSSQYFPILSVSTLSISFPFKTPDGQKLNGFTKALSVITSN